MNHTKKQWWLLTAIAFAVAVTMFVLQDIVFAPSQLVLELGGDAIKNFYSYTYHTLYDKGMWFTGMNYPYGENIVYADGQPALSLLLIQLRDVIHLQLPQFIAIMYLAIAVSFCLAIVYVYKILVHFKVAPVWAMIFAALIICMSPQQLRIGGHFGLAYSCIIPIVFYWLIMYDATAKLRYVIRIFILGCIAAFIHPYFIAVCFLIAGMYGLVYFIGEPKPWLQKIKFLLPLMMGVIGILVFVKIVMHFTDPVTDRPVTPLGILQNVTQYTDIYKSEHSRIWQKLDGDNVPAAGEGFAYIGVVTCLVILLSSLLFIIFKVIKRKEGALDLPAVPHKWVCVALACLIMGMGIPFVWDMEWLLDYISVFKQFRTLGRFSWIFYYIATIYAAVYLYRWYVQLRAGHYQWLGYGLLTGAVLLWSVDTWGYIDQVQQKVSAGKSRYDIFFYKNDLSCKKLLEQNFLKPDDFQAIITMPYLIIGSEKIWLNGEKDWVMALANRAAIDIGKPIVNVMMSRSSWSQAFKQVKLAGGPFTDKPTLRDAHSSKPFLLLHFTEEALDADSKYLMSLADSIGQLGQCYAYVLKPGKILAADKSMRDSAATIAMAMQQDDTCIGCQTPYVINHFSDRESKNVFFGKGAEGEIYVSSDTLARLDMKAIASDAAYEISIWALVNTVDYRSPAYQVEVYDSTGRMLANEYMQTAACTDNNGMWMRANKYITLPTGTAYIIFKVHNDYSHPSYMAIDELLLRPVEGMVISKTGKAIMANNHMLQ